MTDEYTPAFQVLEYRKVQGKLQVNNFGICKPVACNAGFPLSERTTRCGPCNKPHGRGRTIIRPKNFQWLRLCGSVRIKQARRRHPHIRVVVITQIYNSGFGSDMCDLGLPDVIGYSYEDERKRAGNEGIFHGSHQLTNRHSFPGSWRTRNRSA